MDIFFKAVAGYVEPENTEWFPKGNKPCVYQRRLPQKTVRKDNTIYKSIKNIITDDFTDSEKNLLMDRIKDITFSILTKLEKKKTEADNARNEFLEKFPTALNRMQRNKIVDREEQKERTKWVRGCTASEINELTQKRTPYYLLQLYLQFDLIIIYKLKDSSKTLDLKEKEDEILKELDPERGTILFDEYLEMQGISPNYYMITDKGETLLETMNEFNTAFLTNFEKEN